MTNPAQWHTNYAHEALKQAHELADTLSAPETVTYKLLLAITHATIATAETHTQNQQQPHHTTNHTTTHTENR